MIEIPVGGTPIEPLCSLEGPPCFAHDGRYLGRGPISFERYLRIGMFRRTEDFRYMDCMPAAIDDLSQHVEHGTCVAIGRGVHGEPAHAWQADSERSTLFLELELVTWRKRKLEEFGPNSRPEYEVFKVELKQLQAHEKLLRQQLEPPPRKKLDPKRLP
jgi:hypothetical protein